MILQTCSKAKWRRSACRYLRRSPSKLGMHDDVPERGPVHHATAEAFGEVKTLGGAMDLYFQCLECHAATLVTNLEIPPQCPKCVVGKGFVRPNMRGVEKITGAAAPNDKRASLVPPMERRKN